MRCQRRWIRIRGTDGRNRQDENGGKGVDLDGIGWSRDCIHCQCLGVKEAGIDTAKRFVDKVLTQGFG